MLSPVSGAWFDAAGAGDDEPVGGDALVGLDHDDVADARAPRPGPPARRVAVADRPRSRGELGEGLDGPAGPAHGVALERVAEAEQGEQERTLLPLAQHRGTGGGDQHQEVDLEAAVADALDRLAAGEVAAEECRGDEDRRESSAVEDRGQVEDEAERSTAMRR